MAYKQVKDFEPARAGTRNGWCLQNVRLGYGIGVGKPTAIAAWEATQQHKDKNIPAGEVPLFYTYKNEGHINVRMADGRIWNDGVMFDNLETYLKLRPQVSYLGWGESVNGVKIMEWVPDPVKPQPAYKNWVPANAVGMDVILGRHVESWRGYHQGTRQVKCYFNPKRYGGRYLVVGIDTLPNRVLIDSPTYGRVSLPVDQDATFAKAI